MTAQEILDASKSSTGGYHLLTIEVYRNGHGDCSNGGMSAKADTLLLICPGGPWTTLDCPAYPICRVADHPTVKGHQFIVPCDKNGVQPSGWYMFGGNFAHTSDSRWRESIADSPLKIHDRTESAAQMASMD